MVKSVLQHASGAKGGISRKIRELPRNGRSAALAALLLVDSGLNVQQAVFAVLEQFSRSGDAELASAERHLCSELTYGYLRTEIRIAFVLGKVLARPESLPRPMLLVLGMAVYALLFQDRVPDHAAVHCAVDMVRSLFGQALSRVANGALRSVQRFADAPNDPSFYTARASRDSLEGLALYYSAPIWLAEQWQTAYGRDAARALLKRSFERPWSALRVNCHLPAAALVRDALLAQKGFPVGQWGVAFAPGQLPEVILHKELHTLQTQGAISFQSSGSQAVVEELGLTEWAEPVWDVCSGFGGKTVALLERGQDIRLATDINFSRLTGLAGQCGRLSLPCPVLALADAVSPPVRSWQGHILVDAPCSGLGVLSRRPDIRRRSPQLLAELERLQLSMLFRLSQFLMPGRQVAYITCTLRPEENEKMVSKLLGAHSGLRLVRQWQTKHDHPWMEGMFGALLERRS